MPVRAHTLPVDSCLNLPWADFCKLLHTCWEQSTALANWCARELDRRDVVRLPGMAKLPPMPDIPKTRKGRKWLKGLYGLASVTFDFENGHWKGSAVCASSICRSVERKYRKERFQIIWGGDRRGARYRYPYPYPVHASCWDAEMRDERGDDGKVRKVPVVVLKLPGAAERLELRLRGSSNRSRAEFGRQLAAFRDVASGKAKKLQLLITRRRASEGCRRRTTEDREPGGGSRTHYRIMVKLIAELPERKTPGPRVLTLCTDPKALWVFGLDGRRDLVLNQDHIRRGCVRQMKSGLLIVDSNWLCRGQKTQEDHKARRQRWSQDCKAERRTSKRHRQQFQDHRDAACSKQARQMDSWCKETAAHVARFAARQKVGHVLYLDKATGFLPIDCMSQLNLALANALAGYGIALDCATDEEAKEVERSTLPPEGQSLSDEETQCQRLMKLYEMAQRRLLATEARLSRSQSSPAVSTVSDDSPTSPSATRSTSSAESRASRKRTPRSGRSAKRAS